MPFFSCHLINVCVSVGFQMWLSQLVMVALCYFNSSATFVKAAVRAVSNGVGFVRQVICYFDIFTVV